MNIQILIEMRQVARHRRAWFAAIVGEPTEVRSDVSEADALLKLAQANSERLGLDITIKPMDPKV